MPAGPDCSADASIDDGSYDPDPGDTITLSQSPAGPYPLGETAVTLTVIDNHGASSQCTATVTVIDKTPPNYSCPPDVTVAFTALPPPFTTVTDNCDPNPTVTFVDATADVCPMIVTRSYTATDASGNVTTCQQLITVNNLFAEDSIIWHQPLICLRPGFWWEQVQNEIVDGLGVLQGFVEFLARGHGLLCPARIAKCRNVGCQDFSGSLELRESGFQRSGLIHQFAEIGVQANGSSRA